MRCGHCGEMVEDPAAHKCADAIGLLHQSGVNLQGEPFVQLIYQGKILTQLTVAEARAHGWSMLEAAEAAEQDAFMYDWVQQRVGAGPQQAAGLIADFRRWRELRTTKRGGPSDPQDWVFPEGKKPKK